MLNLEVIERVLLIVTIAVILRLYVATVLHSRLISVIPKKRKEYV